MKETHLAEERVLMILSRKVLCEKVIVMMFPALSIVMTVVSFPSYSAVTCIFMIGNYSSSLLPSQALVLKTY